MIELWETFNNDANGADSDGFNSGGDELRTNDVGDGVEDRHEHVDRNQICVCMYVCMCIYVFLYGTTPTSFRYLVSSSGSNSGNGIGKIDAGATNAAAYGSHSSNIVDTLDGLLEVVTANHMRL